MRNTIVKLNFVKENPDTIHFAHIHPDDGRALRFHFDEFMSSWIPKLAAKLIENINITEWSEYFGDDLCRLYIEQILYLELIESARNLYRRDFAAKMGWHWNKSVYIVSELAPIVKSCWPGPASETIVSSSFLSKKIFIKNIYKKYLYSKNYFFLKKQKLNQKSIQPMIGVELVEGLDLTKKNDVFWMHSEVISPQQIIFIIEKHNLYGFDVKKNIQYAKKIGAKVVSTDYILAQKLKIPYWLKHKVAGIEKFQCNSQLFLNDKNYKAHNWLKSKMDEGRRQVQIWQTFFSNYNIVIYQHFTELTIDGILRRIATRRNNSIEVGRMRSQFFSEYSAAFYFQHQFAMVWKKDIADVLRKGNTGTEFIIEVGYPYDYMNLKRDLELKKINFFSTLVTVSCIVFDNHPHHNNHITKESLEEFYDAIISIAEKYSFVGLLIKTKKLIILEALPDISFRLNRLVKKGQCFIVSNKYESSASNAIKANIALGFPGSTSACEASLLGCISLIFDPSGATRFSEKNFPRIIFNNSNAFREEFEKLVLNPTSQKHQESFRRKIAADFSGIAAERAAKFLNTYLQARKKGAANLEALNITLNICSDYVFSINNKVKI